MVHTVKDSIRTRQIAFLLADGVDAVSLQQMKKALEQEAAVVKLVGTRSGTIKDDKGNEIAVDMSLLTTSSVLFDAVFVPAGAQSVNALMAEADAVHCYQ